MPIAAPSLLATLKSKRLAASAYLAAAGLSVIAKWWVLLFAAIPDGVSAPENALSLLHYLFAEAEHAWYFYLMAIAPVVLLTLSIVQWQMRRRQTRWRRAYWVGLGLGAVLSLLALWPTAILVAYGGYLSRGPSDA